jgi:hypothetical protein
MATEYEKKQCTSFLCFKLYPSKVSSDLCFFFFSYWCLVGNFGNDPLDNYQYHNPSNPQQPIHSLSFCSVNPWISACLTHHNGRLHLAVMAAFQDKT